MMPRLMEQLEVVGMREKVIEVSDYFDVTLACKDGERISAQFCYNLSIYHCTSDLVVQRARLGVFRSKWLPKDFRFTEKSFQLVGLTLNR